MYSIYINTTNILTVCSPDSRNNVKNLTSSTLFCQAITVTYFWIFKVLVLRLNFNIFVCNLAIN